jgi:hypothetical protein
MNPIAFVVKDAASWRRLVRERNRDLQVLRV